MPMGKLVLSMPLPMMFSLLIQSLYAVKWIGAGIHSDCWV